MDVNERAFNPVRSNIFRCMIGGSGAFANVGGEDQKVGGMTN
jgi:hypothetical protein